MSTFYQRGAEKRRNLQEMRLREQEFGSARPISPPKPEMEQEKRIRREIANSNERRRMQSINSGFQSLKLMIPHQDGEKVSKAAILQHTTEYIYRLETDRRQLITENAEMKQMLRDLGHEQGGNSPPPKRKKRDTESSDEGIDEGTCDDHSVDDTKRELHELRRQLDIERRHRILLQSRLLEEKDETPEDNEMVIPKWIKEESDMETAQRVPRPSGSPPVSPPHTVTFSQPDPPATQGNNVNPATQGTNVNPATQGNNVNPATQGNNVNLSLSRRNLDIIVEAINHLEGDRVEQPECERSVPASCVCVPHSEESGTESSYDQEDCSSEDCLPGSSSPMSSPMDCEVTVATSPPAFTASVQMAPQSLLHHHGLPILSANLPSMHCSMFTAATSSQAYTAPLQLLSHPIAVSASINGNPHLSSQLHQHTNPVIVMQKS